MPEHLRVLGGSRGDVPHRRRAVYEARDFCQIDTGRPADFDADEPRRVAASVGEMGLRYSTITGVARDDLDDGGAWLYAETVRQIHALDHVDGRGTGVELLIPDFNAKPDQLAEVFSSRPEVLAHNVETVPRIFKRIRPAFRYERSLSVITQAREAGLITKSNLILGMGETNDEIISALQDLHDAGCDIITITQYLRPSPGTIRSPGGSSPPTSSCSATPPRRSASSASCRVRSCAPRTARVACGRRRCATAGRRSPPTSPTSTSTPRLARRRRPSWICSAPAKR